MRPKLQSQQILLKFLGFYNGKCDGIWGPDSIAAMRKYEADSRFNPGYPTNGMPLKERGQLPSGVYRTPRQIGILKHVDMPDDFCAKFSSELFTEEKNLALSVAKVETVSEEKPKIEIGSPLGSEVALPKLEDVEFLSVDSVSTDKNDQSKNQHRRHNR